MSLLQQEKLEELRVSLSQSITNEFPQAVSSKKKKKKKTPLVFTLLRIAIDSIFGS